MVEIVNRSADWAAIEDALSTGAEGAILVVGAHGLGKSTLLVHLCALLAAPLVRADTRESGWEFAGISAIIDGLEPARATAAHAALSSGRAQALPVAEIADAVTTAVRTITTPGAICIDDVDRLDASSAAVLAYLLRRLTGTGLRVVATATFAPADGPFAALARMDLHPFSRYESLDLVERTLPGIDAGVAAIIAAFAGGNPAVLHDAVVSRVERSGDEPIPLPLRLPVEVSGVPHRRRERDSVLAMVALAPCSALDALAGFSPAWSDEAEEAVQLGVLEVHHGRVSVADPISRSRMYAAIGAPTRRRLHGLGEELHRVADPAIALWHRSFVDPTPDMSVDLLTIATIEAEAGEVRRAIEYAERARALRLGVPDGEARALLHLARAYFQQGEFALAELSRARMDPAVAGSAVHIERARLALHISYVSGAPMPDTLVTTVIARHRDSDPDGCAALLADLARLHVERWEFDQAERWIVAAHRLAPRADDAGMRLIDAIVRSTCHGADRPPMFSSAPDLASAELATLADSSSADLLLLIRLCILVEEYDRARDIADLLASTAPPPVVAENLALLTVIAALRDGATDRLPTALAAWEAILGPECKGDAVRAVVRAQVASTGVELSQSVEALIAIAEARADGERSQGVRHSLSVLRGAIALGEGRFEDACEHLRPLVAAHRDDDPALLRASADLVESLWFDGRHAEAHATLATFRDAARRHPSRWSTAALARAVAVCADDTDVPEAFDAAARAAASVDDRDHLVRAKARRLAKPLQEEPDGAVPVSLAVLDTQELEIARLVHQGLRNRDIARMLFLSQRTVELRLTHIYRKLGITSRARLVALMSARP